MAATTHPIVNREEEITKLLLILKTTDLAAALGACAAFLLHEAEKHPRIVHDVMHAPASRPGATVRIIDVLAHVAG